MSTDQLLEELITLSREAGREERQLAILGEGNTSADAGDGTFWVKASGTSLSTANADSFSRIRMDAVLAYVERAQMSEVEVGAALADVLVDPQHKRPSTATFMHAVLLSEGGALRGLVSRCWPWCPVKWAVLLGSSFTISRCWCT